MRSFLEWMVDLVDKNADEVVTAYFSASEIRLAVQEKNGASRSIVLTRAQFLKLVDLNAKYDRAFKICNDCL